MLMVKTLFDYIVEKLANDPFGEKLGINYSDDEMGAATYNYGILKYDFSRKNCCSINWLSSSNEV